MYEAYLEHHGIKGQKWGERRYQNMDGSLTPAGRSRYGVGPARKALDSAIKKAKKGVNRVKTKVRDIAKKIKTKSNEHAEASLSRAISKGNVRNILKYVDRLDERELNDALKRAKTVKDLSDLRIPKEKITNKIKDVASTIGEIAANSSKITKARHDKLNYRIARDNYNKKLEKDAKKEREEWDKRNKEDWEKLKSFASRAKSKYENIRDDFNSTMNRNHHFDDEKARQKAHDDMMDDIIRDMNNWDKRKKKRQYYLPG